MEKNVLKSNNLIAELPLWILRGTAVSMLSIAFFLFASGYKINIQPNDAQAQCVPVGLSYVGSCSIAAAATCKCNAGETIMLLQQAGRTSSGAASSCGTVNQNSSTVYGTKNNSNAYQCIFSCFR